MKGLLHEKYMTLNELKTYPLQGSQVMMISHTSDNNITPLAFEASVFFFFWFQLAPHHSSQQRMFSQSLITIYLNRKLCCNWLINMQSFQRNKTLTNKQKASLLAVTHL